ncbi:MAG: VWA domain-containing protein [Acidobacteriota bacterium]|nr:VWA domain-containing protein [Acidobacteriota bacterium]
MSDFLGSLLVFGRLLRRLGLDVHVGRLVDVAAALQHVNLGSRDEVFYTCRTLLVHRHEDLAVFDRAFAAFWRPGAGRSSASVTGDRAATSDAANDRSPEALAPVAADGEGPDTVPAEGRRTWSDRGTLADRDVAELTAEELTQARYALDHLAWSPGLRRTRRWVPGRGARVDLRRAVARSVRSGGDVLVLPRRRRRTRPRPVVLLCDVSGSMERYSRLLVHFAHALSRRHGRVETFLFSTALTRITTQLRVRRPDHVVSAIAKAVPDWSGGTRIGGALREFHQQWSRRSLRGGPVVLLVSDGWDRGDPLVLREQVARLQRSCHRLVWLNPLIGTVGYEPLTRGLQAALPFVDDFLPARTLRNFADLALHLNTLPAQVRGKR